MTDSPDQKGAGDSDAQAGREKIARLLLEGMPHTLALGMELDFVADGEAGISMAWSEDFVGDPESGVIHGGVVSALLDTCSGTAVLTRADGPPVTATLDLRIDYMRAAKPGQRLRARAKCYHITRSVAFVRAWASDDDEDKPVAMAAGAFTAER
ncbi:MAG: PaaI family thioesterase [Paracoccus sp. (in: a-proteobacteria)]|nr:PaaI family thioesterase [Paracoccus sp. (in: a-proteobacteria)]